MVALPPLGGLAACRRQRSDIVAIARSRFDTAVNSLLTAEMCHNTRTAPRCLSKKISGHIIQEHKIKLK